MKASTTVNSAKPNSSAPLYDHWIDGRERPARTGAVFERINPFDGSVAGVFAQGDAGDAQAAIEVARKAFDEGPWPRSSARTRYEVLTKMAQLLAENMTPFAHAMVLESGKPLKLAMGEVLGSIKTFQFYAGLALAAEGSAISDRLHDALGLVLHEPIGVAGLITPWNFPMLNPVCKIAPAIAAGCTVVIKPSHLCPGPTVLLGQYLSQAGLPGGVVNVITSDLERGAVVGQVISESLLVDKVAFTGSTTTGRAVMRAASTNTKRVSLELGGKSANIVFNDAPFEEAAATAINAFCFNSGQQCSAGSRLLVQRGIHDKFVDAVVEHARRQILGDPMKETTTMGPLINSEQHARVMGYVELGKSEGRLATGGEAPSGKADSLFLQPTIFTGVKNSARLAQEEVFGPVLAVIPFETEEDAIRIANDSRYGLAGGVWTRDINTAIRVAKAVRTGKMFVNSYNSAGLDDMPHGGYKDSGVGREFGPNGLEEFQQVKTIQIKLGK